MNPNKDHKFINLKDKIDDQFDKLYLQFVAK